MIWKIRDRRLPLEKTLLMGILNVTPDSFSDGGRFLHPEKALDRARQMIREGADILDIGGESSRPGAQPISATEELKRILPVLEKVCGSKRPPHPSLSPFGGEDKGEGVGVPISVDTTKPDVARICLEKGAHIINDISGLRDSGAEMAEVVREFGAGLVLMHRRGDSQTMQAMTQYDDVVEDILSELKAGVDRALTAGIAREQLVIDPGLGFAKTAEQNIEILSGLQRFHELGFPVLVGPSRKSFLGNLTGREVGEREFATAAVTATSVLKGVHMLRVHEISAARDAARVVEAIRGENHVRTF